MQGMASSCILMQFTSLPIEQMIDLTSQCLKMPHKEQGSPPAVRNISFYTPSLPAPYAQ
jgi:hypothetical protein